MALFEIHELARFPIDVDTDAPNLPRETSVSALEWGSDMECSR